MHDVSIEDVGVQDHSGVVVVQVGGTFGVGLWVLLLVLLVGVRVILAFDGDGRVRWTCLLIRDSVVCSKGHAGAKAEAEANGKRAGSVRVVERRRGAVYCC